MRFPFLFKTCFFILLTCGFFTACNPKDENPDPKDEGNPSDRELMLAHYADEIIIPAYKNFKVKMDSLKNKTGYFKDSPTSTTLSDLRTAWIEAYIEWQKVELFDFGPGFNQGLRSYMNIYPANETAINANIASGNANLEPSSTNSQQGFPALDYLINGSGTNDTDILSFYTTASDASLRLNYLEKVANQMSTKTDLVYHEWTSGYRNTFVSRTGIDASSSTSEMVNYYVHNYEKFIRSGKIAYPSGAMNGTPAPEKVEGYYKKDLSKTLVDSAHQASIDFFNGKSVKTGAEGPSLKTYLNGLNARDSQSGQLLSEIINNQFNTVNSKIDLLGNDLYAQVQTNNQPMIDAFNEMQKAVGMLKVDMTSALSISITYTDTDGD